MFGGGPVAPGAGGPRCDKSLSMGLIQTFKNAWADPDLRARLVFVLGMFAVFVLGVHIPVPVPGVKSETLQNLLSGNSNIALQLLNMFGGGALRRISIFALSLTPYITASIIMQILTTAYPQWKKDLQEGGDYARRQQNKRTRALTLILCIFQGLGIWKIIQAELMKTGATQAGSVMATIAVMACWTAGAMFVLWIGEQISEKGIGNGVSLMIFAGIVLAMPFTFGRMFQALADGTLPWYKVAAMLAILIFTTWFIVYFTVAQRRIPIQHMRRQVGTKVMGGQTSYLPLSVNMVGVIPIIFAQSLLYIPGQISIMFKATMPGVANTLESIQQWISPASRQDWGPISLPVNPVGILFYSLMIFFFTYFYTAIQ
jgi:preprotein translocase subunit SecY